MIHKSLFITFLALLLSFSNSNAHEKDEKTPFSKIKYINNNPHFMYNEKWVKITSIEGIPIKTYLDSTRNKFPIDWKWAFFQNFNKIMDDMNLPRKEVIKISFKGEKEISEIDIELKAGNKNLVNEFYYNNLIKNKVIRKVKESIPDSLKYLNIRIDGYKIKSKEKWLSKSEAIHDLDYLEWEIENYYSYANLRSFNYQTALDAIKNDLRAGISKRDFALQIQMFLANFGDGHTKVSYRYFIKNSDYKGLPFKIIKHKNRYYAINTQLKEPYHTKYPYIVSINGKSINKFYEVSKYLIAKTTPKFIDSYSEAYMQLTSFIMLLMDEDVTKPVTIVFKGETGTKKEIIKLDNYPKKSLINLISSSDTIFNNNIGYIPLRNRMKSDSLFILRLHSSMQKIKGTKGLIIDIRKNSGGSRAPLKALLPYFIKKPVVTNVARYRINKDENISPENGYLIDRYLYPANYKGYSKVEKKIIRKFAIRFKPSMIPAEHKFTDYHYMIISPSKKYNTFYYKNPVIILTDEDCFSASDIFAAGIKQGDNVTLLGNTTGGGSGFSKPIYLPNSSIRVKLSQMFSYQPNGEVYDGHGVKPDIHIDYTLSDKLGKTDSQLDRALKELK